MHLKINEYCQINTNKEHETIYPLLRSFARNSIPFDEHIRRFGYPKLPAYICHTGFHGVGYQGNTPKGIEISYNDLISRP